MGEKRKSMRYPYVFLKCFTPQIDDLPMWEMYGDKSKGCCVVFDFSSGGSGDVSLFNICYINDKTHEADAINNNEVKKNINLINKAISELRICYKSLSKDEQLLYAFAKIIGDVLFLFKSDAYAHEKEKRIIINVSSDRDGRILHTDTEDDEIPMLYVKSESRFHIKEVILGPKDRDIYSQVPFLQERLDILSEKYGMPKSKISTSAIDFKRFIPEIFEGKI